MQESSEESASMSQSSANPISGRWGWGLKPCLSLLQHKEEGFTLFFSLTSLVQLQMGAKKGRSGDVTMDTDFEKKTRCPLCFLKHVHISMTSVDPPSTLERLLKRISIALLSTPRPTGRGSLLP